MLAILVVGAVALVGSPLRADTWDFSGANVTLGTSQSYTGTGGIKVKAYGFQCDTDFDFDVICTAATTNSATALYGKNLGGDEMGVGIAGDPLPGPRHEISQFDFINMDMTNLANLGITSGVFTFGSLQPLSSTDTAESFKWCSASAYNVFGTGCSSSIPGGSGSIATTTITWSKSKPFVTFVGTNDDYGDDDFLIDSLSTRRAVPEPASLLLFGTGLAGVMLKRRKRTA